LLLRDVLQHRENRVAICSRRSDGILVTERSSYECGKRDDGVSLLEQRQKGAFDADVALYHAEICVIADMVQAVLLVHEAIEHCDLMSEVEQIRNHDRPEVTCAAGDKNLQAH